MRVQYCYHAWEDSSACVFDDHYHNTCIRLKILAETCIASDFELYGTEVEAILHTCTPDLK